MADYYSQHCSKRGLKVSKEGFDILKNALEAVEDNDSHGFTLSFDKEKGEVFIIAEETGDTDYLPEGFLELLGSLIKSNGLPYLEFGYGLSASRIVCDGLGGGDYRIYPQGYILYPIISWPE